MEIALIPCQNGLGHIKRTVCLANKISDRIKVTIFCDPKKLKKFKINSKVKQKKIKLASKLDKFKSDKFTKWIENKKIFKNRLIYSDNLTEVILKNKKSFIYANFIWNKIFNVQKKIFQEINKTLIYNNSTIYCNYLFYNKESLKDLKLKKVGFFGKFLGNINKKNLKFNILISLGTADIINFKKISKKISIIINKYKTINFFLDPKIFYKYKNFQNIFLAKYDQDMFNKISAAIVKPGFSILNDCFQYGIPIFTYDQFQNKEFKYNSKIIEKKRLGYKSNSFNKLINLATNLKKEKRKNIFNKYKNLKWNGEIIIKNDIEKYAFSK
jgi:hypothetical protein